MTTNRIEFNAAIGFLVLAVLFMGAWLIHLPLLLSALCGVLSLVSATQGLFAKPNPPADIKPTASATTDEEA